ncbi:sensor histidine kinase [Larkinella rosea]|uniref:histidine kinase n=1 Tax=Larkinella rosea TaxID=2025312 RepID=A0A3P1C286_9BACT|nr:PAS domain S-box protein [Larkinella rosea]RRB06914.1 PAS domain S-box protein [Larkinella rosea]
MRQSDNKGHIQQLESILDSVPVAVLYCEPFLDHEKVTDFRYIWGNNMAHELLTLNPAQVQEMTMLRLYPALVTNGIFDRYVQVYQTGESQRFEREYPIGTQLRWVEVSVSKKYDGLLITALDITDSKHRQHILEQKGMLRRINQRLEGLRAIDQALLSPRSTDQSPLLMAMRHINAMVPCERLTVFWIDESKGIATAECRLAEGVLEANPGVSFSTHYLLDLAQPMGQATYFPVMRPDTAGIPPELGLYGRGFRSLVVLPLFLRQKCIGAFTLLSVVPNFFANEHLEIAQEVASQLAIVLSQQHLDEQINHYTEQLELRVAERTREITQLSAMQQAILEHAGQAILSTDIHGVIQTANQACEKLLGYTAEELIGRVSHIEFTSADDPIPLISYRQTESSGPASDFFQLALASQGYFYSECLAIDKTGNAIPILLATSILQDNEHNLIGYVGIATDISALKAARTNLAEKDQELKTFFEGALDMHCIIRSDGSIQKVNQAWEMTLGYSAEELVSVSLIDLVHPAEQASVARNLRDIIPHHPIRCQINQFRKKDGTYRVVEWNAVGVNKIIYASARDITERQEAMTQLQKLNQRLQLATQAVGQGIWEDDLANNRLFWDQRLWAIHGFEHEQPDWSLTKYMEIIHPDDLPSFLNNSHLRVEGNVISNVARIFRPDGVIRYVESKGLLIRDARGNPVQGLGVAWDVTERIEAEIALRESEQRFRQIAENVDEVFWIYSADPYQLLYVNPAYERIWGCSSQALYENPASFLDAVLAEDRPLAVAFLQRMQSGQEVEVQYRITGSQPGHRWVSVRSFIKWDDNGKPLRYIGIANDITSQKEKEIVLQQTLDRELELNKLKSQFVSTASHEFRTPLMTIQSSVDLIRWYINHPAATTHSSILSHLNIIQKEIQNFGDLLSDMLTIGKIDAGKTVFQPYWMDMLEVCRQVIATHFSQQGRTIQIRVFGTPGKVFADAKLIGHVLVNLLSNAVKFSIDGVKLFLTFQKSQVTIQVIDDGIGIPEADLPSLFQAFFRARNTTGIHGTGLGLVIARQFVELHRGSLTIESQEGQGTTARVILPNELST